uniref:NADH-ubiquinone oxidoreductase chain 6 n=1 Tax=Astrotischeria sp. MJT-2014 TaxID=1498835 RepID=A0A076EG65_9NEOP|nr:NADH dehydrogenase subunit 6 [Astrotischeria sp. MJT-2014]
MKIMISMFILLLSMMMYFMNHPLSMGLTILIQTLLLCLLSGMFINTYWFSYILFLTFMGGLLVLFIYVSSIASNEMFNFSLKWFLFMLLLVVMMSLLLTYLNINYNLYMNSDMMNFFENINLFNNKINKFYLSKLYNSYNFYFMMMLIIYLFITLLSIVKITNVFYGPIRMMK